MSRIPTDANLELGTLNCEASLATSNSFYLGGIVDIIEIMATIQHRYPFLLVDRIVEMEPGVRGVGLKNVTMNEPFFQGHFPGNPIMPGVLIVEHAAQVSCALILSSEALAGKLGIFTSMEEVKFRRTVKPGDQIFTEVSAVHISSRAGKIQFTSRVDGQVVAEGRYTFLLVPDPAKAKAQA
jgi:3-hydroxyacyl-[acyl-carrier-protein] dehydratase